MNQATLFEIDKQTPSASPMEAKSQESTSSCGDNLVFFDTETTGLGPQHRLCQLAYKTNNTEYEALFKPPLPIDPGASAVTGITDDMVASKEVFIGSAMAADVTRLANDKHSIFIAHNAAFDIEMLSKEGIAINRHFDTLRIARVLDDGQAQTYKQEYLREYYDLKVDNAKAHDALGDVRVLEALFNKLSELISSNNAYGNDVIAEMTKIMEEPILYKKFTFGKYRGQLIQDVVPKDPGYLKWLLDQKKSAAANGQKDPDWEFTLNHYLSPKK